MTSEGRFDEAAVGYGGLHQVSALLMGSHVTITARFMVILSREVNANAFSWGP
eukprot:COSAG02_NODE_7437_length_3014_cov_1.644475_5_plen_53_part_00